MEVTLTQPRTYLEIQLNGREITQNKPEQEQERILKTLYTWKKHLQHNLPTHAQQNTRGGGQSDPQLS